jgi:(p)ppGpp synthase/HD superfamily hydrolase
VLVQYPINGFAPGNYNCVCFACDQVFEGDKQAIACEPCALDILVKGAEEFARQRHGEQLYDSRGTEDLLYADTHLAAVVEVLKQFEVHPIFIAAGCLHDVIEDTPTTREDISRNFGEQVASLVWACTGIGKNRRERNASIYEKISRHHDAAIVKVADRIANVEASDPESGHRQMYLKERDRFSEMVAVHAPKGLVERLEAAYEAG